MSSLARRFLRGAASSRLRSPFRLPFNSSAISLHTSSLSFASLSGSTSSSSPSSSSLHHPFSDHLPYGVSLNTNFIVSHAKGSYVHSTDRSYLDFTCGIGVTNLGHCHPRVQSAVREQMEKGAHLQVNCYTSQPLLNLAEKIGRILPPGFPSSYQILFSNSGAEAIENSIKIARVATKRQTVIVFQGGFHGRTIGAGSLTTAKYIYRSGFQPMMAGVHVAPFPYCHRCAVAEVSDEFSFDNCCMDPFHQLKLVLKQQTGASEVAAVLIEPVLGEGGYVPAPPKFLHAVRQLCSDIGALMIVDEVQSGYGRTGYPFAIQHSEGVVPDMIVAAKGIANGYPLSAVITSASIMSKMPSGSIGGTFGGNAVSCAAGSAVIDAFEQDGIMENVRERGQQLRTGLEKLKGKFPIADVRGLGLMIGMELEDSVKAGTAGAITKQCVQEGLLLLTAGVYESIRFIPPLTVSEKEIDEALEKLETGMSKVLG